MFCLATNQIAQTGLSSLPPVIYYSEQLFRTYHHFFPIVQEWKPSRLVTEQGRDTRLRTLKRM
ncbi:hypothetical protein C6B42_21205 [Aeromonas caviae]|nr:hypothetical protein C6B42_21205 [Aeromonas caviae]